MSLKGKTVLVTRAQEQAGQLTDLIEKEGGKAIVIPLIAFERMEDLQELDDAIKQLSTYQWLLLTSVNGVHFFMKRFIARYGENAKIPIPIVVVGEKTEAVLLEYGQESAIVPTDYTAEGMVTAMTGIVRKGDRLLLARGNRGRNVLNEAMKQIGAYVHDIKIYRTTFPKEAKMQFQQLSEKKAKIDYVTFTSSSTVTHFASLYPAFTELLEKAKIACIGPIAAKTATDLEIKVDLMPGKYTIDALVQVLACDAKGGND